MARLLREHPIEPTIIDLNLNTVRQLMGEGCRAVYGDAKQRDPLGGAGVERAASLVLSAISMQGSNELFRLARELNPGIRERARTSFISEIPVLTGAGAQTVFSGEAEIALAFAEFIPLRLGASPEQIDRERDQIHNELNLTSSKDA